MERNHFFSRYIYMNKTRKRLKRYSGGNGEDFCPICLSPISNETEPLNRKFKTACGHSFHVGCLHPICISRPSRCPICRRLLSTPTNQISDCDRNYFHMALTKDKRLSEHGVLRAMKENIRQDFQLSNSSDMEMHLVNFLRKMKFDWLDVDKFDNKTSFDLFRSTIYEKLLWKINSSHTSSLSRIMTV